MYGNDAQLDYQINILFNKWDMNRSGYLSLNELYGFLTELYASMGYHYQITYQTAQTVLYQVDRNCDGRVSRKQVKLMYYYIIQNAHQFGLGGNQYGSNMGTINLGYNQGYGSGFNTGINTGFNTGFNSVGFNTGFNTMGSFQYNGSWNNSHDSYLQSQIDRVYMIYDRNGTGQLEANQFYNAYRDLCGSMGKCSPMDYNQLRAIAMQSDTNFDGRISKQQMFALFKRAQFNLY